MSLLMTELVSVSLNEPLPQYYQYPETGNEAQCTFPFMVLFPLLVREPVVYFCSSFQQKGFVCPTLGFGAVG